MPHGPDAGALAQGDATRQAGRTRTRLRWRSLWIQVHLWLGLSVGGLLAVLALIGSLLVFVQVDDTISDVMTGGLTRTQTEPAARLDDLFANAVAVCPPAARVTRIFLPWRPHDRVVVQCRSGPGEVLDVALHPDTGAVLESWDHRWSPSGLIRRLHTHLLLDDLGLRLLAVFSAIMLVLIATGVYLWWPGSRRMRWAFKPIGRLRGPALFFELHRLGGIYLLIPLVVTIVSGFKIVAPETFNRIFWLSEPPVEAELHSTAIAAGEPLSMAHALDLARRAFPAATPRIIEFPRDSNDHMHIGLALPDGITPFWGEDAHVHIDRRSGTILEARAFDDYHLTERIHIWLFALHNGQALGAVGRAIIFVTGLVPALLLVTGTVLWLRKRRLKGGAAQRARMMAACR